MAVDDTLARARAEIAAGDTARARERLHGLLAEHPARLDVRAALADAYRAERDVAQAGRWSYLDPTAEPAEVAAFLRAYPDPLGRVRAMRWSGPEGAAGPAAAARLAELRRAAELATGAPVDWSGRRTPPGRRRRDDEDPWSVDRGCFLWTATLLAIAGAAGALVTRTLLRR